MNRFVKAVVITTLIINIVLFISFILSSRKLNRTSVEFSKDTTINRTTIDSIQYNIIIKDNIINNLKHKKDEDIKKSECLYDTAAVELFKRLVSE